MCGGSFDQYRPQHRFCKDNGCKIKRAKARWNKWRDARETEGVFRDIENARQRTFRERTGYARDYELRSKYGITLAQWLAMVEAVGGRCEICSKNEEALCVDHDHESGKVRGVLCRSCNRAVGQLGDTHELLSRAVAYLKRVSDANRKEVPEWVQLALF